MNRHSILTGLVVSALAVGTLGTTGVSHAQSLLLDAATEVNINIDGNEEVVREITVRYKPGVNRFNDDGAPNGTSHIAGVSFTFGNTYPNNIFGMRISPTVSTQNALKISDALMSTGLVEFADIMMPVETSEANQWHECLDDGAATDSCTNKQAWYIDAINATAAWNDSSANTAHAVVAVVDSGKLDHPDLVGNLLPGYDFIERSYITDFLTRIHYPVGYESSGDGDGYDDDATDEGQGRNVGQCKNEIDSFESNFDPIFRDAPEVNSNWHGTAVGSIIAATRNNNIGIAGIAPAVKIVPVRVLGRCVESDDPMNLVHGMMWATGGEVPGVPMNSHNAHVVNLSLGSYYPTADSCPTVYREVIAAGMQRGAIFVASAGNDATKSIENHVPSNCPGVISVGAVGKPTNGTTFSKAWYSTSGADVVAPGGETSVSDYSEGILVASNTETRSLTSPVYQYKFAQGTSYAAPIVSALIAMAKTKYRTVADNTRLTPAAMKQAVIHAATLGAQCVGCGNGLLTSTNLFNVLDSSTAPTVARSVSVEGRFTVNQGQVSWVAPTSHAWNPVTSYVAKAYSAASGGVVIDTCSPTSLAQLSCMFDDLVENTTYYVSVTAATSNSTESTRTAFTTFRRAVAPGGVTVTPGSGKAIVSWNEVTDFGDFMGFGLYEAVAYTSQFGGTVVGTCYGNSNCEITNLTGGTRYWIEVSVMTGQHPGGSVPSARFAVTPSAAVVTPPGVPTNTNTQSPTSRPTMTSKVGKSVKASTVQKRAGVKVVKGSKVTLSVAASSRKVCRVTGGSIRMIRKGKCTVTITVKPKKGKSTKAKLTILAQ
jgi:serine protease